MSTVNDGVAAIFERLWQPGADGSVSRVRRPTEPAKCPSCNNLQKFAPRDVTRKFGDNKFNFNTPKHEAFIDQLCDQFSYHEESNLTGLNNISRSDRLTRLKSGIVKTAKVLDRANTKVNDWIDSPSDDQ